MRTASSCNSKLQILFITKLLITKIRVTKFETEIQIFVQWPRHGRVSSFVKRTIVCPDFRFSRRVQYFWVPVRVLTTYRTQRTNMIGNENAQTICCGKNQKLACVFKRTSWRVCPNSTLVVVFDNDFVDTTTKYTLICNTIFRLVNRYIGMTYALFSLSAISSTGYFKSVDSKWKKTSANVPTQP